ncbi:MAG: hypothetical protein P8074_22475 [Anaerolineales bacterium]|jgi:hypothetical protein
MNMTGRDVVEEAAQWLEKAGFEGDLSAFTSSLHDIHDGITRINVSLLPSLLALEVSQREDALQIVVDLELELEHIRRHAEGGAKNLIEIRDFLDTSPRSGK